MRKGGAAIWVWCCLRGWLSFLGFMQVSIMAGKLLCLCVCVGGCMRKLNITPDYVHTTVVTLG